MYQTTMALTIQFPTYVIFLSTSGYDLGVGGNREKKEKTARQKKTKTNEKRTTEITNLRQERKGERLRLQGILEAFCSLPVLAYLLSLNVGLCLLSPVLYCLVQNWLAKADSNDPANMNLLSKIMYS